MVDQLNSWPKTLLPERESFAFLCMVLAANLNRHMMRQLDGQEAEVKSNHGLFVQLLHCRYLSEIEKPLIVLTPINNKQLIELLLVRQKKMFSPATESSMTSDKIRESAVGAV